jgi:hypothetical protein
LLNVSIGRFNEGEGTDRKVVDGGNRSRSWSEIEWEITKSFRLWTGKSVVSLLISITGFLLMIACDLLRRFPPANTILRIGTMAFILSAVITHVFKGKQELPGYKLYQPFEGGYTFMLLQGFSWLQLGVVVQAALFLPTGGGMQRITLDGAISCLGLIGLTSQILLLASLRQFNYDACTQHAEDTEVDNEYAQLMRAAAAGEGGAGGTRISKRVRGRKRTKKRWGGYTWEALIATFCVLWALLLYSWAHCVLMLAKDDGGLGAVAGSAILGDTEGRPGEPVELPSTQSNASWFTVHAIHAKIPISPAVICRYAVIVMNVASPLAHIGGLQMHEGYRLWQPFSGGIKFVFAQAIGWFAYAVTLALNLVCLVNGHTRQMAVEEAIVALSPFSAIAPVMVLVSLRYFEGGEAELLQRQQEELELQLQEKMPVTTVRGREKQGADSPADVGQNQRQEEQQVPQPRQKRGSERTPSKASTDYSSSSAVTLGVPGRHVSPAEVMMRSPEAMVATAIGTVSFLCCVATQVYLCPHTVGLSESTAAWMQQELQYRYPYSASPNQLLFVGAAGFSCAAAIFHVGASVRLKAWQYRLWQPFQGGRAFYIRQALGWFTHGMTLFTALVLSALPLSTLRVWPLPGGGICSLVGVMMAVEQGILMASIHFLKSERDLKLEREQRRLLQEKKQEGHEQGAEELTSGGPVSEIKFGAAEALMGLLFTNVSLAMMVVADLMRGWQQQQRQLVLPGTRAAAATDNVLRDELDGVLLPLTSGSTHLSVQAEDVLFACGAASAVLGVMICHCVCGAMMRHDQGYRSWQPFKGGLPFVLIQGIGWLLFALALLFTVMILSVGLSQVALFGLASAAGCILWMGQMLLWMSLRLFRPVIVPVILRRGKRPSSASSKGANGKKAAKPNPSGRSRPKPTTSNGSPANDLSVSTEEPPPPSALWHSRNAVSILLCVGSWILFAAADVLVLRFGPRFPVLPILVCAVVAIFAAVPLTFLHDAKLRRSFALDGPNDVSPGMSPTQSPPRSPRSPSSPAMTAHKRAQPELFGELAMVQILGSALWSFSVLLGVLSCYGVWCGGAPALLDDGVGFEGRSWEGTKQPGSPSTMQAGPGTGDGGLKDVYDLQSTAKLLFHHSNEDDEEYGYRYDPDYGFKYAKAPGTGEAIVPPPKGHASKQSEAYHTRHPSSSSASSAAAEKGSDWNSGYSYGCHPFSSTGSGSGDGSAGMGDSLLSGITGVSSIGHGGWATSWTGLGGMASQLLVLLPTALPNAFFKQGHVLPSSAHSMGGRLFWPLVNDFSRLMLNVLGLIVFWAAQRVLLPTINVCIELIGSTYANWWKSSGDDKVAQDGRPVWQGVRVRKRIPYGYGYTYSSEETGSSKRPTARIRRGYNQRISMEEENLDVMSPWPTKPGRTPCMSVLHAIYDGLYIPSEVDMEPSEWTKGWRSMKATGAAAATGSSSGADGERSSGADGERSNGCGEKEECGWVSDDLLGIDYWKETERQRAEVDEEEAKRGDVQTGASKGAGGRGGGGGGGGEA